MQSRIFAYEVNKAYGDKQHIRFSLPWTSCLSGRYTSCLYYSWYTAEHLNSKTAVMKVIFLKGYIPITKQLLKNHEIKRKSLAYEFQVTWKSIPEVSGRVSKALEINPILWKKPFVRRWLYFGLNVYSGHK